MTIPCIGCVPCAPNPGRGSRGKNLWKRSHSIHRSSIHLLTHDLVGRVIASMLPLSTSIRWQISPDGSVACIMFVRPERPWTSLFWCTELKDNSTAWIEPIGRICPLFRCQHLWWWLVLVRADENAAETMRTYCAIFYVCCTTCEQRPTSLIAYCLDCSSVYCDWFTAILIIECIVILWYGVGWNCEWFRTKTMQRWHT